MCDVLILKDDPLLRMLFAYTLSGEGLIVREAGSAAEAWAVSREPAGVCACWGRASESYSPL